MATEKKGRKTADKMKDLKSKTLSGKQSKGVKGGALISTEMVARKKAGFSTSGDADFRSRMVINPCV
jgi:hypothetical protein